MKTTPKLVFLSVLGVALNGVQLSADDPIGNTAPSDKAGASGVTANQTPTSSSQPLKPDPIPAVDPAQADLIAQIIALKKSITATTPPEEVAAIMAKIAELNKQLAVLQGSATP